MNHNTQIVQAAKKRVRSLARLDRGFRVLAALIALFAVIYFLLFYSEYPSTSQTVFIGNVTLIAVIVYTFANAIRQHIYWLEMEVHQFSQTETAEKEKWLSLIDHNTRCSIINILFNGAIRDFPGVLYLPQRLDESTNLGKDPQIYKEFWHYLYLTSAALVMYILFLITHTVVALPIVALYYLDFISSDSLRMLWLLILFLAHVIYIWSAFKMLPKLSRERRAENSGIDD